MREHILVFQFEQELIRRMHCKRVVVKTNDTDHIHDICRDVNINQNSLHCLVINHKGPLASVPFHESWRGIPLAIFVDNMGPFKEIMRRLPLLRDMSLRIFMKAGNKENLTNLHILASLGVDCGVSFDNGDIDWEALNDLMTYSVYSKAKHASVEPFHYLGFNYDPTQMNDFSSVYFNNPHTYLHIDAEENIAATENDLKEGKYIAKGMENLNGISENEKFVEAIHSWQEFFLMPDGCAYCQAWRVCLGKFAATVEKNPGCKKFFVDMMEAADHLNEVKNKSKRKELWQP